MELQDGREVWLSRSVAVTACILLLCEDEVYILINKRGVGLPDFPGFWNLPCGYLDYDENTMDAARREVWEECGVDVDPLLEKCLLNYFDTVWDINSTPRGEKQNVSIHHGLVAEVSRLPSVSIDYCEPNEVDEVVWGNLNTVLQLEYAFSHDLRIVQFLQRVLQDLSDQCPTPIQRLCSKLKIA